MKIAVQLLVIYWNYTLIRSNDASVRLWDNPVLEGTIVCTIFHFASQWVLAEKCSEQCSLFAHSWHDYKVLHTWHFLWSPWLWCLHGRFTVGLWDWNSLNWNTNHTVHIHHAMMLHCKTVWTEIPITQFTSIRPWCFIVKQYELKYQSHSSHPSGCDTSF